MSHTDAEKWNDIYQAGQHARSTPAAVLKEHAYLLPKNGTALDLACGIGANALFLAQLGLRTYAWDISEQAIARLNKSAAQMNLDIRTEVRDVITRPPDNNSFDVIVVSYFLERTLMADIISALRKQGLLFYQTFIKERIDDSGPSNHAYRLAANELLSIFSNLHIVFYHEEGMIGDSGKGFRNEAMLIAQRR